MRLTEEQQRVVMTQYMFAFKMGLEFWSKTRGGKIVLDKDDCVQEAMLGLMYASIYYREELGPFCSYASTAIHRRLKRMLDNDRLVCINQWARKQLGQVGGPYAAPVGAIPGTQELSNGDFTNDVAAPPDLPFEDREWLAVEVKRLPDPRWRLALRMYFGLDGNEPQTLQQIGDGLGRTKQNIQQWLQKSLEALRCAL